MSLKIDYAIDKIIKEIIIEVKREQGEDISYELVTKVLEQQLKSTVQGLANGHKVVWKHFGNFIASTRRINYLNKVYDKIDYPVTLEDYGVIRKVFKKGVLVNQFDITTELKKDEDIKIFPTIPIELQGIKQSE